MEKFKILIVDDDAEDRGIIKDSMELIHAGDIIHFAENGEKALEILEAQAQENHFPCLVVLDLNMPRLNGTETLRRIKANPDLQKIPIVIYSTSINPLEKEKCMLLGASDYITKPLSFRDSQLTAQKLLGFCDSHLQVDNLQ